MKNRMHFFFIVVLASFFNYGNACTMEGVTIWAVLIADPFKDVDTGVILSRGTTNVDGITVREYGGSLAGGPYVNVELTNNHFIISTNENYPRFEHNEITDEMSVTVDFACTGGGQQSLVIIINIIDTNNNSPEFLPIPTEVYEIVITPPLRPGYLLTGCSNDLIVRDIDLTTYRINFAIQENPYIKIEFDEAGSAAIHRKEFKAILSTTSFIRTLEEPLELWITATDVDQTGNEPRTTRAMVRIVPDTEFVFPQEPIFSQTFYLADYTKDHQLILSETIYLRQGYDSYVDFKLEGEYDTHFEPSQTNNQVSIVSLKTLPLEDISENQIHVILRAEREYTSGDTATLIIRLPEATPLNFENPLYEGKIEDDKLNVSPLVLSQGYENKIVTAEVVGEYSAYFTASVAGNRVTVTTRGDIENIIRSNNFISLPVRASTDGSESTTVLSLDIIKDDNVTPVFDKPIYNLDYDPDSGLTGDQIVFVQGFDSTVATELLGEHQRYFDINRSVTGVITITRTAIEIPEAIFDEQNIILSIKASKARTVGANAAIIIRLPEGSCSMALLFLVPTISNNSVPDELFSKVLYEGVLENDIVSHETITLTGYSGTDVGLFGEYSALFEAAVSNGAVTVTAKPSLDLPENVTHLTLELRAGTARTVLLINVITIDLPSETFSKVLFEGHIRNGAVSHEPITVSDYSGIEVELVGEYSSLFQAVLSNSAVTVTPRSPPLNLPEELTYLTLELRAGTARTVLLLNIESEDIPIESFSKALFEGHIRNGALVHETITLSDYSGTEVELFGEYSSLFAAILSNSAVTVTARSPPLNLPEELTHITLELRAGTARTVLLLNIETEDIPIESFSKVLFEGHIRNGAVIHEAITLSDYSGTEVELLGEHSSLFEATLSNNVVTVAARSPPLNLPEDLTHLTLELRAGTARTVLLLNIETEDIPIESFSKVLFEGHIRDGIVNHEVITLSGYSGTEVELSGEYSRLFRAVVTKEVVTVTARSPPLTLPDGQSHLTLELRAGTATAVLLLNIQTEGSTVESFSKVLYEGHINNGIVTHEAVTLSEYSGTDVELLGEHSSLFKAILSSNNEAVTVIARSSPLTLPEGLTHLTLELRAGIARAVVSFNIETAETPIESFSNILFEGHIRDDIVSHESITLSGYSGTEVGLFGEHSTLFVAVVNNNAVTVNLRSSVSLPTGLNHLTLELRAGIARAILLLNIENTDTPPESNESFSKVLFEGVIQNDIVSHEVITLSEYSGTEVELLGAHSSLFVSELNNNVVTINRRSAVSLPTGLSHLTLELRAGTATAVLLLNIENEDTPPEPSESFSKVLFEGVIRNDVVSHEQITLSGYTGTEVELLGEYSVLFAAVLNNNAVTVNTRSSVTIPAGLTHITLELRAGTARSVLILNIENTDLPPESNESFSKVLFEGALSNGVVNHEAISLFGYSGTDVGLFGEHASLFVAILTNNEVTVNTRPSVTLPTGLNHLTLELRAGIARAVLLLDIENDDSPTEPNESFSKVLFEGVIRNDVVNHEEITLSGYTGTEVELLGEFSILFAAVLNNNAVTVNTRSSVTIPAGLTHITLELRAGTARSVLILNIENTDLPPESNESFSKVLFEGALSNGVVNHEAISLFGYSGTDVGLFGEHASLFVAILTNNEVTVNTRPSVTLPTRLNHLTLELRAGIARAVLLLDIENDDSPTEPNESFSKVLFEGVIRNDVVNHEEITLSGYTGTEVELLGEFSILFAAVLNNNAVTVNTRSSVTIPAGLTHITLELRAGTARSVLILNIENTDLPPESNESFSKVLFEGALSNGVVNHEAISLFGYSGTDVGLFGEHASLFVAILTNNEVTVNTRPSVTLPTGLNHLTLELRAGIARAVLLLDIENDDSPTEPNESFSKVLFEGVIRNDVVNHEEITLSGYTGTEVELLGEFSILFAAVLNNNAVTVNTRSSVTIPAGLTHITLELRAGTARSVLILNIENTDLPPESNESFSKVLFEGALSNGVVNHEAISLFGYSGTDVELFGEHASLFVAILTNNAVTVNTRPSVTPPTGLNHLTLELRAGIARAVLLLDIENDDSPTEPNESFSKVLFEGVIRNDVVSHEQITLSGYTGTEVELLGEYSVLFAAVLNNNAVTVNTRSSVTIPAGLTHITLELRAGTARSVLILNIENTDLPPESNESFSKVLFEGALSNGVVNHEAISLFGYSGTDVELFGEHASLFVAILTNNEVTVNTRPSVTPPTGLDHLTLELRAGIARAVLLLDIENDDSPTEPNESFSKVLFEGVIRNDVVSHEQITLSGYTGTEVELLGEYSVLFAAVLNNNAVTVNTRSSVTIPAGLTHITLELRAGTARSVLILDIENTDLPPESNESFSKVLFEGSLSNGVVNHEAISLFGYSGTDVGLFGEHASLFVAILTNNEVTVNTRPSVTLPTGLNHLTLELRAGIARAVLLLDIENDDSPTEPNESFSKVLFEGIIRNDVVSHEQITLSGYTGTEVELLGEYSILFAAVLNNNAITVNTRSSVTIPAGLTHITLELRAGTARSVLILNIENTDLPPESNESFSKVLFEGALSNGVVNHEAISLFGYSGTDVGLFGEHASLFVAILTNNEVTVNTRPSVTLPTGLNHLKLELRAGIARAVLLLDIENDDSPTEPNESFNKVLFEGVIRNDVVSHEQITLSGYTGTEVELSGEYESLFEAGLSNNAVTVTVRSPPLTLPEGLTHLTLELRAGTARSVLLLNIENTDTPVIPVVTFSAESYSIRVDISQTGLVGQVRATADNGEPINYSLQLDSLHLGQRLSINNAGELHLSAPVSGGLYAFRVVGTTAFSQAVGTATIHLTVEAVTVCGEEYVMPPLITLERVEEEPHHDLLSETQYEGCHFSIANRWPLVQNWLYVDGTGLHTRAIDREHESIAFMPLSQVQVEITLHCDNDNTRVKRSLNSDSLGPYDYGPNQWILTDSIPAYNSRRTLLNLIVTDINDNYPIFDGKLNEPIAVGYTIPELEAVVLPRSLTQVHATDADIGENAAIVYSSPNSELAVSPLTGFVHVRNGARLEQNAAMTVHATDRNGQGNRGTIDLIVKLLDQSNIAVVTVRDAFLDDEASVVSYLSDAVGYDVRVLRSVVVSQEEDNDDSRRIKRETTDVSGASLELYIYGLIERDPVDVDVLTTDISNAASTITVNVANIVSLEDHLEGREICTIMGRDTGLLVATIVLSVLLFVVIVLIAIWAFLKWRKNTYQKFEDTNSVASRGESLDPIPKPEILPKARINPDELKRSERRLQEILDAPVEAITVEPIPALKSLPIARDLIELPPQESSSPIVIQSIDKLKDGDDLSDDEFGEIKQRRKSVVTFNENVEKIIHMEDNEDSQDVASDPDLEVYKF